MKRKVVLIVAVAMALGTGKVYAEDGYMGINNDIVFIEESSGSSTDRFVDVVDYVNLANIWMTGQDHVAEMNVGDEIAIHWSGTPAVGEITWRTGEGKLLVRDRNMFLVTSDRGVGRHVFVATDEGGQERRIEITVFGQFDIVNSLTEEQRTVGHEGTQLEIRLRAGNTTMPENITWGTSDSQTAIIENGVLVPKGTGLVEVTANAEFFREAFKGVDVLPMEALHPDLPIDTPEAPTEPEDTPEAPTEPKPPIIQAPEDTPRRSPENDELPARKPVEEPAQTESRIRIQPILEDEIEIEAVVEAGREVRMTDGRGYFYVNDDRFYMDASAYISPISDSMMLPVRFVSIALEIPEENIIWNDATRTVTIEKDDIVLEFTAGSNQMIINGVSRTILNEHRQPVQSEMTGPSNMESRMYLPLRAIATAFGVPVDFNDVTRTAYLNPTETSIIANNKARQ